MAFFLKSKKGKFFKFSKGFTLVELLIVMAVLGVLATGVIVLLNPAQQLAKGRDARRKTDLHSIQQALDLYYNDHQAYPDHCSGTNTTGTSTLLSSDNTNWFTELSPYLKTVPTDPINTYTANNAPQTHIYQYQSVTCTDSSGKCNVCTTQHYTLGTQLEVPSDPNINWNNTTNASANYDNGYFVNFIVGN